MTETIDTRPPSISPDFKSWQIGQPYNFPLPKSDGGDPWKILLEQRKRDDYGRCEVWKDEVQNLLVFAGLSSAVVTAFVVESYATLQEDPNERVVLLLNQISSQLRDPLPSNTTLLPESNFSANASDLRVNIFWFLSLIFSLITVLVGIVSLQWLREYQRSRNIEPRLAFALHHMHTESLDAWYMPEIFASLPLLLQLALVLFLIGLCDFAWNLDRSLSIPVIITIILTLIFLIVTTVLPTVHAITLLFRRRDEGNLQPRVQCPYNSPQAWAFHRFYCLLFSLYHSLHLRFQSFLRVPTKTLYTVQLHHIFNVTNQNFSWSWTDLGLGWLFQRDADYINATHKLGAASLFGETTFWSVYRLDLPLVSLYDSARALSFARDTINPSTLDGAELTALYACVSQFVDSVTSANLGYNYQIDRWVNYSYYVEALVAPAINQTRSLYLRKSDPSLPQLLDEANFVSFFIGNRDFL